MHKFPSTDNDRRASRVVVYYNEIIIKQKRNVFRYLQLILLCFILWRPLMRKYKRGNTAISSIIIFIIKRRFELFILLLFNILYSFLNLHL